MTKTSLVLLAALALAGCPEDETETDGPPPATAEPDPPKTTAAPAPSGTEAPTDLTVDKGDKDPSIGALAKAELDGREDGAAGTPAMTVGSAKYANVDGWKTGKAGKISTSEAKDGKSRFGAGTTGDGRDGVAAGMGLTNCKWNPDEDAKVGKDKLEAQVADGVCDRGAGKAKVVSASFSSQNSVAVAAWDEGANKDGSLSIIRSVTKVAGGGGGIAACCQALRQNSVSAPPEQKGAYIAAAGLCQSLVSSPQGRAALGQVRAMLRGANVPSSCL